VNDSLALWGRKGRGVFWRSSERERPAEKIKLPAHPTRPLSQKPGAAENRACGRFRRAVAHTLGVPQLQLRARLRSGSGRFLLG